MSFVKTTTKKNYLDFSLVISGYSQLLVLWAQPYSLTICGLSYRPTPTDSYLVFSYQCDSHNVCLMLHTVSHLEMILSRQEGMHMCTVCMQIAPVCSGT